MTHIKTLIFDLGNVIVPFAFSRAYRRIERLTGLTQDVIAPRMAQSGLYPRFESGQIEPEPFVDEMNQLLGTSLSVPEFRDLWVSIFLPDTLIPEEFLRTARSRFRLVLLSNTNALHYHWLAENYPHFGWFHHHVLSYEAKAMKPSPLIYAQAIEHGGGNADACFYTDDVQPYVDAGRQAGLDAEQFTGFEKLLADLGQRGIRF
ncbi:MAG: hypothetical protein FJW39_08900 [Acidobacteria bacterium]|nr:hypothetical protein [Acidobacteriota bacterium]